MSNKHLANAKKAKNDEFYTQLVDLEKELQHYTKHFKGKVVFCNCDDPTYSNFWKYFHLNFGIFELKKLVATHYSKDVHSYKMEYLGGNDNNCEIGIQTPLKENGDFRSQECVDTLKESDIVVTNPPFSLFREYVAQLIKYDKKFIIIGNKNAITYKNIFPLIKNNELRLGYNHVKNFMQPNGIFKQVNTVWYTNCQITKHIEKLFLTEKYDPERYPKYDNYDAINVDKVSEIPKDYDGIMGVPISFMDKYCPEQFEIVGSLQSSTNEQAGIPNLKYYDNFKEMRSDMTYTGATGKKANGNPVLRGKPIKGNFLHNEDTDEFVHSVYARIAIRKIG